MKKIFISQPMRDKTEAEINKEREYILQELKKKYNDDIHIIDTYFAGHKYTPLQCLGKSIELLSKADLAVFAAGWEYARGCKIEHECAVSYGIPVLYMNDGV